MLYLLLPILTLGHLSLHVAVVNRLHGSGLPRWLLKISDVIWYLGLLGIPLGVGIWYLQRTVAGRLGATEPLDRLVFAYLVVCCVSALLFVADRVLRRLTVRTTERLIANHTHVVSLVDQLGHRPIGSHLTSVLSHFPGNEILHLSVHEKQLVIPRLDPALHGLRITHLSDLHLTGQLSRSFYDEIVRQANDWESDLVAITGDIVERVGCLDWLPDTLGRLKARLGVYFVLGNHEQRIRDEARVRAALTGAGLTGVGGRWKLLQHAQRPIAVAGNELPWFSPAADLDNCPREVDGQRPLRILLAHSPDQLRWARTHDCDLMLAGHTHGGQVRLPLVGPILSPSRQGTRFASGTFFYAPTLMHVSRGIAGTRPLRLNCPPELARLVLCSESAAGAPETGKPSDHSDG